MTNSNAKYRIIYTPWEDIYVYEVQEFNSGWFTIKHLHSLGNAERYVHSLLEGPEVLIQYSKDGVASIKGKIEEE